MALDSRYPAISDLRARARQRIPRFIWEYLDSATGTESGLVENRRSLDRIRLLPRVLLGSPEFDLSVTLMGRKWSLPFGVAPVGMSGAVWPGAEAMLAAAAHRHEIPYGLSTMATRTPEEIGPIAGPSGWFQLYPPGDRDILADMLARVAGSGFDTLVLTVDVPMASRRERQTRGGLTHPPKITARTLADTGPCPAWAFGTLRHGLPKMPFVGKYASETRALPSTAHIGYLLRIAPDWAYLEELRDRWQGRLVVKGILRGEDASRCAKVGVDAVWVSNHAARQFDGAPGAIDCLPDVRAAVPADYPVIFDSGIESGLDILRAFARGADFVMLGKAWHYALGALGSRGPDHLVHILTADLKANMGQLGIARPVEARDRL